MEETIVATNAETNEPTVDYEKLYKETLAEKDRIKSAFDKASSETAEYKRKLSEHLTAEEAERLAREEADKAKDEELALLREEKRVSSYNAKMLECGVASETAIELAKMLPNGVPDEFFNALKKFVSDETARIKAEALKKQPALSTGMPVQAKSAEDLENDKIRAWMGLNKK